jgi:hypothetical protein
MVSVMTTHPSSMVAHADGKLCEHLTGTQARYPSIDLVLRYEVKTRPSPRTDFRTMSGVLNSRSNNGWNGCVTRTLATAARSSCWRAVDGEVEHPIRGLQPPGQTPRA